MSEKPDKFFKGNRPPDDPNNQNKDDFQWKRSSRSILFWVILFLGVAFLVTLYAPNSSDTHEVPYSTYLEYMNNNKILRGEVVIQQEGNEFLGTLREPS